MRLLVVLAMRLKMKVSTTDCSHFLESDIVLDSYKLGSSFLEGRVKVHGWARGINLVQARACTNKTPARISRVNGLTLSEYNGLWLWDTGGDAMDGRN